MNDSGRGQGEDLYSSQCLLCTETKFKAGPQETEKKIVIHAFFLYYIL